MKFSLFHYFRFSSNIKKIFENSTWLIFEQIIKTIVGLFVGIWVARFLGPKEYGLFNYAIAIVALLTPISKLGLDGIGTRELVKQKNDLNMTLGSIFWLKLFGSFSLLLLSITLAFVLRPENYVFVAMVGIIALGFLLKSTETIDLYFRSILKNKYTVISKSIGLLTSGVFKIIFILIGLNVIYFALANFIEALITSIFLIVFFKKSYHRNFPFYNFKINEAKKLLNDSWPLMFAGIFAMLFMHIDKAMLGAIAGDESVGLYSAAVKVSTIFYIIPMAIKRSSFPIIIDSYEKDVKRFDEQILKVLTVMALFSYLIVLFIAITSSDIINMLFGLEYAKTAEILFIHIFSCIFVFSGLIRGHWVIVKNITKFVLVTNLIGAIINISLNIVLIPKYEGIGAAWATLISYAIAYFLVNCLYSHTMRFFILQIRAFLLIPYFRAIKNYF